MTAELIDGRKIAARVRDEVRAGVEELKSKAGLVPKLAVLMVGNDPASDVYVKTKEKAARSVGIETRTIRLGADVSEKEVTSLLDCLNEDDSIHGILVQLPLPEHMDSLEGCQYRGPDERRGWPTPRQRRLAADRGAEIRAVHAGGNPENAAGVGCDDGWKARGDLWQEPDSWQAAGCVDDAKARRGQRNGYGRPYGHEKTWPR